MGYPEPLEQRLEVIRDVGFDSVCLDTNSPWEPQLKLAQQYGLPVDAFHLTGDGMTDIWNDGERAEFLVCRLEEELYHLRQVGVPIGVAHITWGYEIPAKPSASALERFRRIAESAEKYGVYLALENSVFEEHVRFVLDNLDSSHLGFCYDSGHENAFTPQADYLDSYGDRLFAMHLHDNDGKEDQHQLPFHGTVDWEKRVSQLKKTQLFHHTVTMEVGRQAMPMEELVLATYQAAVHLANW
jgi:sugar phosphate isomerase/epimerase